MNANSEKLQQSYNELLEFKMILQKVNHQFYSDFQAYAKPINSLYCGL